MMNGEHKYLTPSPFLSPQTNFLSFIFKYFKYFILCCIVLLYIIVHTYSMIVGGERNKGEFGKEIGNDKAAHRITYVCTTMLADG